MFYFCKHASERSGVCQALFDLEEMVKVLASEMVSDSVEELAANEENVANYLQKYGKEQKRNLPFDSLHYGRRKRQLPFETLNYGKRSSSGRWCQCENAKRSLPFDSMLLGKRALPFDSMNYGKRALPFESLNFGKRGGIDIPIDGYIIGKREE